MDSAAAAHLAEQLTSQQEQLCQRVAARMLRSYPELANTLRLDEGYKAADRLSEVAIERLSELVRAVLLFELPALADAELTWASGVLPSHGVGRHHVIAMVHLFFEELRHLPLSPAETILTRELEGYFVASANQSYI